MVGNGVFEPRDAQKGRSARSVLYCLMRFGNQGTFVNVTQEQVLKNWNYTFLPDSIEQRRCNDIFSLQHNRNPFIDHPLMAKRITSFISFSQAAMMNTIYFDHTQIEFRDALHDSIYNLVVEANGNQDVHISNIHFSMPSSNSSFGIVLRLIHLGKSFLRRPFAFSTSPLVTLFSKKRAVKLTILSIFSISVTRIFHIKLVN